MIVQKIFKKAVLMLVVLLINSPAFAQIPTSDFTASDTIVCDTSTVISFTNLTTGNVSSRTWTFGDGSSSTLANPTHKYTAPGVYTVRLTSHNNFGFHYEEKTAYIKVYNYQVSIAATSPSCNGYANGTLTASVTGGVGPYQYYWTRPNGTPTLGTSVLTNTGAGTYELTVEDVNGCTAASTITVSEPPPLVLTAQVTPASCPTCSDGRIVASASGGTPSYSFNLNTGPYTANNQFGMLSPGNYTIGVRDVQGCLTTQVFKVDTVCAYVVDFYHYGISCYGGSDGQAYTNIHSAPGPFSHQWSTGDTSNNISSLGLGTYGLTVTDQSGCTYINSFTIQQPWEITINSTVTDASCATCPDGSIQTTSIGGITPYLFNWSNGTTSYDAPNLLPGIYTITVTDVNNCQKTKTDTVGPLCTPINIQLIETPISCSYANDGELQAIVSGGTAPYTYTWTRPGGNPTQAGDTIMQLDSGKHTLLVTDVYGCTGTASKTLSKPTPIVTTATVTHASCGTCADGAIDGEAIGGQPPYLFVWNINAQTEDISGLLTGLYHATVVDNNGCYNFTSGFVDTATCGFVSSVSLTGLTCHNDTNGRAFVTTTGSTGPYTYQWSGGTVSATGDTAIGLTAGTYTVTTTDAHGCTAVNSFTLLNPAPVSYTIDITDATCFGAADGYAHITTTGGEQPYTGWCPVGWPGWPGWSSTYANYDSIGGLPAGTHSLTVTDNNGCATSGSFVVNEPSEITVVSFGVPPSCTNCANGTIDLQVTGGKPPYSYVWSNGYNIPNLQALAPGSYKVTVSDANGCVATDSIFLNNFCNHFSTINANDVTCNGLSDGWATVSTNISPTQPYSYLWSTGDITATANNLIAGTYTVTVTDAVQCQKVYSVAVNEPPLLKIIAIDSFNATCATCPDGSLEIFAGGGMPPYRYSINGSPLVSTQLFTGLTTGPYVATVIDDNNCVATDNVIVNYGCSHASMVNASDVTCFGLSDGWASVLTNSGPTQPYSYLWSTSSTNDTVYNLSQGTYTVTVTDAVQCQKVYSVTINEPPLLEITGATITHPTCSGCSDGSIDASVVGGTPPYTGLWAHDSVYWAPIISNLSQGIYIYTAIDANTCVASDTFELVPCGTTVTSTSYPNLCSGINDGAVKLHINGANGPYLVDWGILGWGQNPTPTQDTLGNLPAGTMQVEVTDNSGCVVIHYFTVLAATPITVAETITDASCATCNDGRIDVNASGGEPPYTYLWSTNATVQTLTALTVGFYDLTVTDGNGCQSIHQYYVDAPNCNVSASLSHNDTLICGSLTLDVVASGGTPGYIYLWSTGETTLTITIFSPGTYGVTVTDANNCTATDALVVWPGNPNAMVDPIDTVCLGASTQLSASGGVSYAWSPASGLSSTSIANPIATPTATTTYQVTITDANGCAVTLGTMVWVDTDCVWPGDADKSGLADNNDVLAIGLKYGSAYTRRPNASLVWEGQPSPDWVQWLSSGVNCKHVDTNGDSIVNADDTLAISLNYGLTHLKTEERSQVLNPNLYIDMPDTAIAGQTTYATIYLGTDTAPVQNVYGIKFSVTYDNMLVDTNTVHLDISTSWLGTAGVDLLGFKKDLYSMGRTDVAITRINQTHVNGWGPIGLLSFTMKDDVSGKDLLALPMTLEILSERAIDAQGLELPLTTGNKYITVVQDTSVGVTILDSESFRFYPNPTTGVLTIAGKVGIEQVSVYNSLGQLVQEVHPGSDTQVVLQLDGLSGGLYMVKVITQQGIAAKRILLERK